MSITTTRGGGQSDSNPRLSKQRPPHRSLKFDRAITAARRFHVFLPSYLPKDVYKALKQAGIEWCVQFQQWEPVIHV